MCALVTGVQTCALPSSLHLRPCASDLRTGLALLHPRARFAAMIALRILAARMIAALRIVGAGAVGPREGRAERGEDGRRHQQSPEKLLHRACLHSMSHGPKRPEIGRASCRERVCQYV